MGVFSGIETERGPNEGGNYFARGRYLIEVGKFIQGDSQQGDGAFTALECEVKHVFVSFEATDDLEKSNQVGERVSWVQMLQKHKQTALSNVKGFIAAACDCDLVDVTEAACEAAVGEPTDENGVVIGEAGTLLTGTLLIADCNPRITKKNQRKIVIALFSVPTAEELTAAGIDAAAYFAEEEEAA